MTYFAYDRWGASHDEPSEARMLELLAMLDLEDDEHPSVALLHESEWCLEAFPGGLLIWENVEDVENRPRHMDGVSRQRVFELWRALARGDLSTIDAEPWLPGYG